MPSLAVPDGVVPLEVLDEQAGRGHVVAVDDGAVAAGVGAPALGVGEALDAVVGAPHPGVVDEHVVAVDLERDVGLADVRPADAEVHVGQRGRVARRARGRGRACCPTRSRTGDSLEAGVDGDAGDDHARHVGDVERGRAVDGGQRGVADAEHHRVGAPDLDAAGDVVHAGGEQQVLAPRELAVDRLHRVATAWRRRSRGAGSCARASGRRPRRCRWCSVRAAGTRTW